MNSILFLVFPVLVYSFPVFDDDKRKEEQEGNELTRNGLKDFISKASSTDSLTKYYQDLLDDVVAANKSNHELFNDLLYFTDNFNEKMVSEKNIQRNWFPFISNLNDYNKTLTLSYTKMESSIEWISLRYEYLASRPREKQLIEEVNSYLVDAKHELKDISKEFDSLLELKNDSLEEIKENDNNIIKNSVNNLKTVVHYKEMHLQGFLEWTEIAVKKVNELINPLNE